MNSQTRMKARVLSEQEIRRALIRIAHEIKEKHPNNQDTALIGIRSRGEFLARRLAKILNETERMSVDVGALDVTLYRDDVSLSASHPIVRVTEIPFDVATRPIVLVDDVLFTGRTIRAAMDALTDLGRPPVLELAVLIDRGHRELPIKADYVGKNIPTAKDEVVQVRLMEVDGVDEVILEEVVGCVLGRARIFWD